MNEIIVLKQEPIITYDGMVEVSEQVRQRISDLNLDSQVVTDLTVKSAKETRAELNKEFKAFEEQRKFIKEAVTKPYAEFEAKYKEFIAKHYNDADDILKCKIFAFEAKLKEDRENELRAYFTELCQSNNIDFVRFEEVGLNITLSASMKSLREQAISFIAKIVKDIELANNIPESREYKDEVIFEYKKSLDINAAFRLVQERVQARKEAQLRAELEAQRKKQEEQAAAQIKLEDAKQATAEPLRAPTREVQQDVTAPAQPAVLYEMSFTVKGTIEQLKALKSFLITNQITIIE